jgi:hypothetical protein
MIQRELSASLGSVYYRERQFYIYWYFNFLLFMDGFSFGFSSFTTELRCEMVDILAPHCNFSGVVLNKTREYPSCHLFLIL